SGGGDEAVEHALLAGLVEIDGQLVAVDAGDVAVAEFLVEDAVADLEGGGHVGHRLRHQLAVDGAALDRGAAGAVAGIDLAIADALDGMAGARAPVAVGRLGAVGLRPLPARRRIGVGEGAASSPASLVEARGAVGVLASGLTLAEAAAVTSAVAAIGRAGLGDLDMGLRQLLDEARGNGRLPQAVDAAVGGEPDVQVLARARQPDIGEAALLLQPRAAALVERALVGKKPFLPAGQEHG